MSDTQAAQQAQDAAMQAAQQANDSAMQAAQQAHQSAMQAHETAMQMHRMSVDAMQSNTSDRRQERSADDPQGERDGATTAVVVGLILAALFIILFALATRGSGHGVTP